jgi:hypothetical protein
LTQALTVRSCNFGTDFLYGGLVQHRIPDTGVEMRPIQKTSWSCCPTEFATPPPVARLSRARFHHLFWGVSGNLRYIVLDASAAAPQHQASSLVGVVAIAPAVVLASMRMRFVKPRWSCCSAHAAGHQHELHQQCGYAPLFCCWTGGLWLSHERAAAAPGHNRATLDRSTEPMNRPAFWRWAGSSTAMGLSSFGAITAFALWWRLRVVDSALA